MANVISFVCAVGVSAGPTIDAISAMSIDREQAEIAGDATGYVVAARAAIEESVAALLPSDPVRTFATGDRICAAPAAQTVGTLCAGDHILPPPASDHVIAAKSEDRVVSPEPADHVGSGRSAEAIIVLGASDGARLLTRAHGQSDSQYRGGKGWDNDETRKPSPHELSLRSHVGRGRPTGVYGLGSSTAA